MFDFCLTHRHLPKHLFLVSFVVFIFLNLIENIIHFSAGKHFDDEKIIHFEIPSKKNLIKIVIIMFIFAFLQGIFTLLLSNYF